jgi:hypothetical protein
MDISLNASTFSFKILKEIDDIKKGENNVVLFGSVGNGK